MTLEEKQAYVAAKSQERTTIQARIQEVSAQRQAFVDEEMRRQQIDASKAFGYVIRSAVREQAAARGFSFASLLSAPEPPEAITAPEEAGPTPEQQKIMPGDGC